MGQEIDSLEIGISSTVGNATRSINTLIGKLDSLDKVLGGINTSSMQNLANGIYRLNGAVNQMKNSTSALNAIGKSLERVGAIKLGNMYGISSATKTLASALTVFNNVDFNKVSRISEFTTALSKFGNIRVGNATNAIPNLANGIKSLVTELEKIDANKVDFDSLQKIFDAISKMGRKTAENATKNLPELAKQLGILMQTLARAPNISNNVIRMTEALAKLSSAGSKVGTATRSINSGLNSFSRSSETARIKSASLAATIGKLYANFWIFQRVIRGIGKAIQSSMDYMETFNYFDVALDKIGTEFSSQYAEFGYNSAEQYAKSFQKRLNQLTTKMTGFSVGDNGLLSATDQVSLGLDPNAVMNFQATIASITNAIGMTGEASIIASKALTMLAGDLSSLKNVDIDQVMDNLSSGMVGMSKAVDKYGISIRMADLQNTLYSLGIEDSVQTLDQNAKTQLRLITMIQQSQVAWGDLANTLSSPSNQLRQLSANFDNLSRMIGDLFVPVIATALPYVNGLVIALQRLVSWIGSLLGVDFSLASIMGDFGGSNDAVSDLIDNTDDLTDSIGGAGGAAEKLNKQLSSFDELNNQMSKNNSGGGGGGGANPEGLDLTDALADAFADYEKVWNEAYSRAENRATQFADRIENTFKRIAEAVQPTTDALKRLFNDGFSMFVDFNFDALDSFWNNYLQPMGKWVLGDDGLVRFFDITNNLLTGINWSKLLGALDEFYVALQKPTKFVFTALLDFYEDFLVPVAQWTLNDGLPALYGVITKLINSINWDKLNNSLSSLWKSLSRFAGAIGTGLISFIDTLASILTPVISTSIDVLATALEVLANTLDLIPTEMIAGVTSALSAFFLLWKGKELLVSVITGASTALTNFGGAFAGMTTTLMDGIQPWDVAIATIFGLKGVLESLYGDVEPKPLTNAEEIELFGNTIDETTQKIASTQTAIDNLAASFETLQTNGYSDIEYIKDLKDRYYELTSQTSLTADEQAELQNIISNLTSAMPELNGYINTETGLLNLQESALDALIAKQEQSYRLKASQSLLQDAYTNEITALQDMNNAQEEYNLALEDAAAKYMVWQEALAEFMSYGYSGDLTTEDIEALEAEYLGATEAVNELGDALGNSRDNYEDAQEDTKELTDYVNDLQTSVNKIDYTQATLTTANAINNMHGIWAGGKQILGQDAIDIYNEIMNGLEPLPDGSYELGNGMIVNFGTALNVGEEDIQNTLDDVFLQNLQTTLGDGYTIAYQEGQGWVLQTADGVYSMSGETTKAVQDMTTGMQDTFSGGASGMEGVAANSMSRVNSVFMGAGPGLNNTMWSLMRGINGVMASNSPQIEPGFDSSLAEASAEGAATRISNLFKDNIKASIALGVAAVGSNKLNLSITGYKSGGFPEDGWFRASHGEMLGQFDNGQSVVANNNQIVTGISQGVQNGFRMAQTEQNMILREQNDLLRQILAKETGISQSDIYNAVKRENRNQYNQTGTNQLVY